MCTPKGFLFSREAIVENLLEQKKANKRKLGAWEAQQAQAARKQVGQSAATGLWAAAAAAAAHQWLLQLDVLPSAIAAGLYGSPPRQLPPALRARQHKATPITRATRTSLFLLSVTPPSCFACLRHRRTRRPSMRRRPCWLLTGKTTWAPASSWPSG